MNPYTNLDMYSQEKVRRYRNRKLGEELPPHVFNIAHEAYYGITAFKQLQSVIVSGESGAGKTEATKQWCVHFASRESWRTDSEQQQQQQLRPDNKPKEARRSSPPTHAHSRDFH